MENNTTEVLETKEKKKREPMTTKQKVFLGLRIAFNVVFYALIIFLFLFSIMNIRGGNGTTDFPNIFGKGFLSVQSDSMERDETKSMPEAWATYKIGEIKKGDLINDDVFDGKSIERLHVGDVITFRGEVNGSAALVTHRIVYIDNAQAKVYTQGDKVAQTVPYDHSKTGIIGYSTQGTFEIVSLNEIKGIVTSVNSGAGKILDTIQKNWLFIFIIPIVVLLIIEVFLVIRNIMLLRGEKNKLELADSKEAMMADLESEKEKMRQELLAELRAQGLAPVEETKPEAEEVTEETQENLPTEETVLVSEEKTTEGVVEDNVEVAEEKTEETETEENIEVTEEKEETTEVATEETSEEVVEEVKEDKVEESTDDKSEE